VMTNLPKPAGRGSAVTPTPVARAARELRLSLVETDGVRGGAGLEALRSAAPDVLVVVAYGEILTREVLALGRRGAVNLHFSLLPRWRGAAPVERAILAGDEQTGVDLMAVEEGLDTGGSYRRTEVPIGPDDSLEELRGRLVDAGTRLLVSALRSGLGEASPQVGEPSYADKLTADDRRLDWSGPSVDVHRRVRLGDAWTTHHGKRLKVWRTRVPPAGDGPRVRAADGDVELVEVQPEGKGRMDARAWANGAHWHPGDPLGS
jgi:methionyl-tRNA formyltransferase